MRNPSITSIWPLMIVEEFIIGPPPLRVVVKLYVEGGHFWGDKQKPPKGVRLGLGRYYCTYTYGQQAD